jgi:mRNA-degrading endonuclease toxin of MazEF toxin-antitoxin module
LARFVKGDVVVVPFPFSDLTQAKRRPALVISKLDGDDAILCQITSKTVIDKYAISLTDDAFLSGSLRQDSNIRPNKIFTADCHIILYRAGHLREEKLAEVIERIISILNS